MAFDFLKQLCVEQLSEIDDSDSAVSTYSALWDQGTDSAERFLPCPVCWARDYAVGKCAPPDFVCGNCGMPLASVDSN